MDLLFFSNFALDTTLAFLAYIFLLLLYLYTTWLSMAVSEIDIF